ncbi:MAG: peptide-binding protein [Epulopiscium sp. Nele67-Bin004]|nr:MAG: peptide-binding protein [Epulopiscium sp. Nele67-Bin004]
MIKKLVLSLLLAGTLVGCSSGDANVVGNSTTSNALTTLRLGCGNFSDSLDPSASPNSAWGTARYGIAEGLFTFDDSMNATPTLCDTYTVDETHTIWEFHIRDGVSFSNGKPLTASAVVDSFEYLYHQEATGAGTNAPSQFLTYDSISANDDTNVVTMVTSKPYADLTKVLSHVNYIIVDVESDLFSSPVGTGPYKVDTNDVGVTISLSRNENYWNGDVPFDTLQILFMEDSTTKSLALQAGDIDMVDTITTAYDLDFLRASDDFVLAETLSTRTAFSYVNYDGVLANDTLREAILLAVDDDTICDITVGGVYTSGYSVLPPTIDYGYDTLTDKTPYNLEKAKQLLDDAGIVDTNGDGIRELNGEEIVLDYVSYTIKSLDAVSEAVCVNLDELGIGTNLRILDPDTHWNLIANSEFDLAICSWITVPAGDPIGFLENWYSNTHINYGSYKNSTFDALYEELLYTIDTDRQKSIIEEIQQILIDDCAVMVHGYYTSNLSSSSKIQGVVMPISETYWITTDIKPN